MNLRIPSLLRLVICPLVAVLVTSGQADPLFTISRLGNLGGSTTMQPLAINDSGLIVGVANSSTQTSTQAFAYTGTFASLGTLGGTQSRGIGVNNAGTIVGPARPAQFDQLRGLLLFRRLHDQSRHARRPAQPSQ